MLLRSQPDLLPNIQVLSSIFIYHSLTKLFRSCTECATNQCVLNGPPNSLQDNGSTSGTSNGVSKGALAGAIVGCLIFLAAAVLLFVWYRRKHRLAAQRGVPEVKDIPASAETVLQRPDPMEKANPVLEQNSVRVYSTSSSTTIDLDPESQHNATRPNSTGSAVSNPFEDNNSIQTAGTEGTNVIPIALVSPDPTTASNGPVRPARSPDLSLNYNLEHVNVSNDSVRRPPAAYASSQISGISAFSSRQSYMSNASYSSDFLNEAPMIVTANKGDVRQVLGVVKPAVISANAIPPTTSDGLKPPPAFTKRPPVGSPLASSSFGPSDLTNENDDAQSGDPFDDRHCSTVTNLASPAASVTTFGQPSPLPTGRTSTNAQWGTPVLPYVPDGSETRPSSMFTQAGSVIGIENATRVNLGMSYATEEGPKTASTVRSPYRTTMGRLITPPASESATTTLEEQQQKALAHAQALSQAQDPNRRISGSSVLSSTSTRTDSILESFPFVPPSPISNRPMRTPPVSPLAQQAFALTVPSSPLAKQTFTKADEGGEPALPSPPDRRTLGMSTGSQFSTASSGLGSFPFQIDSGNESPPAATSTYNGRQRASLDTLALTNDLTSYPLGFDRDSTLPEK